MHKSYRLHEEQLAGIARSIKQMYRRPHIESMSNAHGFITGDGTQAKPHTAGLSRVISGHTSRTIPEMSRSGKCLTYPGSAPDSAPVRLMVTSFKCFRCGDAFPLLDFQYTKKSGLCIPCWEARIKVE
jgi:hypothetical protein